MNQRVARTALEGVVIYAGFRQRAVAKRVTAALTDGLRDECFRDITNGKVQNMLYAVIAQTVLHRYYVTTGLRIGRTVPFPDIRVAVAYRDGLLGTGHFQFCYYGNDTVAMTVSCGVVELMHLAFAE